MDVKEYLRLARLQTSGLTATVPLYGYIAAAQASGVSLIDQPIDAGTLGLMLAMGLAAHVFGFVHNEVADREVDAKVAYRRPKPLAAGRVSGRGAAAFAGAGLLAGLGLAALLSWRAADLSVLGVVLLSVALAAAYNRWGKSFAGGDALLATSIAVFVLSGAAVFGGLGAALLPAPLLIATLAGGILFFNNAFEGGFKDRVSDAESGKRSIVISLTKGAAQGQADSRALTVAQAVAHLPLALPALVWVLWAMPTGTAWRDALRAGVVVGATAGMLVLYGRATREVQRSTMLKRFAAHEMLAVGLIVYAVHPFLPPLFTLLLFVGPFAVFVLTNRALSGMLTAPDV